LGLSTLLAQRSDAPKSGASINDPEVDIEAAFPARRASAHTQAGGLVFSPSPLTSSSTRRTGFWTALGGAPAQRRPRGIPPPPAVRRGLRHRFANPPSRSG